ncbi:MAG TPA: hypothetical protein VE398_19985, partial [Acidobacteriota bacterium]|nr:hypothetical protein [Acidobacteriota bacterium]
MGLLLSFVMLMPASSATRAHSADLQVPGSGRCSVHGRVEIVNPKVKLRGGKADAGGVVVWLTPVKGTPKPASAPSQKRSLEQQDKRFVPHIMVVQVGTEVDFPNLDPFFHNVFSVFNGKPFDLGLYTNGESRPVRFDRPGISYIFCNIHPQMSAVVVAVTSPYFAVSAPDGTYAIKNVPTGSYDLRLWHERCAEQQLAAQSRVVSVKSALSELGVIRLDEAGYIPRAH